MLKQFPFSNHVSHTKEKCAIKANVSLISSTYLWNGSWWGLHVEHFISASVSESMPFLLHNRRSSHVRTCFRSTFGQLWRQKSKQPPSGLRNLIFLKEQENLLWTAFSKQTFSSEPWFSGFQHIFVRRELEGLHLEQHLLYMFYFWALAFLTYKV